MKGLKVVTDENFGELVFNSSRPVMVDFTASWCSPCKSMLPGLIDLSQEYEGEIDIVALDIDQNPDAVAKYNIRGVPTFIIFKGEKVLLETSGSMTRLQVSKIFDEILGAQA